MATHSVHPSFVKRIFGVCNTPKAEPGCWRFAGGMLVVELARAPELAQPGGAIRVEKGRGLPTRVLVFRDEEGKIRAVENRCSHAGRRLDPNPQTNEIECCSIGTSRFDLQGNRASGLARKDVHVFTVQEQDGRLIVHV